MPLKAQAKPIKFRLTINQTDYLSLEELKNDFQVDKESNNISPHRLANWMRGLGNSEMAEEFRNIPKIASIESVISIIFKEEISYTHSTSPISIFYDIYKKYPTSGIRVLGALYKRDNNILDLLLDSSLSSELSISDYNELYHLIGDNRLLKYCISKAPRESGKDKEENPFVTRRKMENKTVKVIKDIDISASKPYLQTVSKLKKLIDINTPIICIQNHDFVRVDKLIKDAMEGNTDNIDEWNPGTLAINFLNKEPLMNLAMNLDGKIEVGGDSLKSFLYSLLDSKENKVVVLKDVHWFLDERVQTNNDYQATISLLHTIGQKRLYDGKNPKGRLGFNITIIMVTSVPFNIPRELMPYVSFLEIPRPDAKEIDALITSHLIVNNADLTGKKEKIISSLKGLSAFEIDRALDMAIVHNGDLTDEDTILLQDQKKDMIKNTGLLELCENKGNIEEIGGLDYLKKYLKKKGDLMSNYQDALKFGVSMPKGIMLVGMPGCGKSMCAKAAAKLFNDIPLLKMDIGNLQGKYVGESESNMRQAIKIAEAAAPCILWIDEIEKTFAGISTGNEAYTTRMFGSFLSWMQDKTSQVYIIATANNINNLPPEFKRKGRFDEIFCMDLPTENERKAIFNAQLSCSRRNCKTLDTYNQSKVKKLLDKTDGFNGADINAVIDNALEELYLEYKSLNIKEDTSKVIDKLIEVANKSIGIKQYCADQLKTMKDEFAKNSFIDATTGEIKRS